MSAQRKAVGVCRVALVALCAVGTGAFAQGETPAPPRPFKPVPSLARAPAVDGNLKDLKGASLAPIQAGAWTGTVAHRKDTLHIGVQTKDDTILSGDIVEVSVHFPGAGTTARGYVWRFSPHGLKTGDDMALPQHAAAQTDAQVATRDDGMNVELAIPARALPRFPAREPLVFELCVTFQDRDSPAESPSVSSNCSGGTMAGHALRLPDDLRKALKLKPPESVIGVEGRKSGWVGFAVLHYPVWVASDVALNADVLRGLVAEEKVDARAAGINMPDSLLLPGNRTVLSVLSGADPYAVKGACDADKELRVALYLVQGRTAERVLEWPVATCGLGRAAAVELNDEGELTLGYTNGATVNFMWSGDHFERTEIGSR